MTKRLNKVKIIVSLLLVLIIASGMVYLMYRGITKSKIDSGQQYETYTYKGPGGTYTFTVVPQPDGEPRHYDG